MHQIILFVFSFIDFHICGAQLCLRRFVSGYLSDSVLTPYMYNYILGHDTTTVILSERKRSTVNFLYVFDFYDLSNTDPYRINIQLDAVVEGTTHFLKCQFSVLIGWLFNDNSNLPDNVEQKHDILIIKHVRRINQGSYICKGYTEDAKIFLAEAIIVVVGN